MSVTIRYRPQLGRIEDVLESFDIEANVPLWDVDYVHRLVDRLDQMIKSGQRPPKQSTGPATP